MSTADTIAYAAKHRWLIVVTVMLVAVLEVLDLTIINVAMPQMMGSLGASSDQITWVLTSYVVSSAIVMLLTGFFVDVFGRKKLLLINIFGFMLSSALCGTTTSLAEMVVFRILQGVFGASLVPISQFVLRDTFSQREQGMAMAIWGVGIMVAPVLGPTIGGYITETFNWRWIFYVNVPVCILALFMTFFMISETKTKPVKLDWLGLMFMIVGVGCLQLFLDRGNTENWFQSTSILICFWASVFGLILFIVRGLRVKDYIVDLSIFRDPTFTISTLLLMLYAMGMFGMITIQPVMMEELMGYPVILAGLVMAPRGLASALVMILCGKLMPRFGSKPFLILGILFSAIGSYMQCHYSLDMNVADLLPPMIIQGIGMGMYLVPLSAMALSKLPPTQIAGGSGFFSFGRNLGMSIGISVLSTVVSRESQINWHRLGTHVEPFSGKLQLWLQHSGMSLNNPTTTAHLGQIVAQQGGFIAYLNAYWLATFSFVISLPLILWLKNSIPSDDISPH